MATPKLITAIDAMRATLETGGVIHTQVRDQNSIQHNSMDTYPMIVFTVDSEVTVDIQKPLTYIKEANLSAEVYVTDEDDIEGELYRTVAYIKNTFARDTTLSSNVICIMEDSPSVTDELLSGNEAMAILHFTLKYEYTSGAA